MIVTELQRSSSALWQSLLLASFTPTLIRLRARLGRSPCPDLDQSVIVAFLEAARGLTFRAYVARNLYLVTQASLFAARKRERRAPEMRELDEETYLPQGELFRVEAHERATAAEVLRIIEAEGGAELRELLLATFDKQQSVRELVDRVYAGQDDRARARAGKRLLRARMKVLTKLRARIERRERAAAGAA